MTGTATSWAAPPTLSRALKRRPATCFRQHRVDHRRETNVQLVEGDGEEAPHQDHPAEELLQEGCGRHPHLAFVANDPFLKRYIVGAGINYNITEIFAVELSFDFSPDLGEADYKSVTSQLIKENSVSPDISRLTYFGSASFLFSPIYGKVAVIGGNIINFDIYTSFGMGMTATQECLECLDSSDEKGPTLATRDQVHPTTNFGGGARIIFSENLAVRLEGKSMIYIETIHHSTRNEEQLHHPRCGVYVLPGNEVEDGQDEHDSVQSSRGAQLMKRALAPVALLGLSLGGTAAFAIPARGREHAECWRTG